MRRVIFFAVLALSFKINAQIITTFVGNGIIGCSGYGGPATSANIRNPLGCIFDHFGNFYFCNQQCGTVCKIDSSGNIIIVAGSGSVGYGGDGGPATAASLNYPNDIAFDSLGNLFIADAQNFRIRKVHAITGIINTFAGLGVIGFGGDGGLATAAMFNGTNGLCFDKHNNLYISDGTNNRIRKINTSGIITTYAGTGVPGFSGDGGPATSAMIFSPFDLAIDTVGNLYFPDANNKRVRKIDTLGIITTIAGTGVGGYNGDGIPATSAEFRPYKIAIDLFKNIYLADSNRIRKIDTTGIIHTIAGTSVFGYNGDGILATSAQIASPSGIAVNICGNVYFGDVGNNRIRKVSFNPCNPTLNEKEVIANNKVNIYPNPASDIITIEQIASNATYQMANIVGSVVQDGNLKAGSNTISIKQLPPGMYMLLLTDDIGKRTVHKIVKE